MFAPLFKKEGKWRGLSGLKGVLKLGLGLSVLQTASPFS
jgi:hypothetical protein